jgi:hypothetical protein
VSSNSDSPSIVERYSKGLELLRQKDADGARREFERVLELNSEYTLAYFGIGCVYALQGFIDRAVEEWGRAVEIDPGCGKAHYALAWAYYNEGDQERGYEHVGKALESGVDLVEVKEFFENFDGERIPEIQLRIREPAGLESLPRLNIFLYDRDQVIDVLSCLFIVLVCFYLLRGTFHEGYPGKYFDATLAFYVAKIKMLLDNFVFYTKSWYLGYELLRFYPPLSTFLPYLITRISGNLMLSYYLLCFLFYAAFCVGIYFFLQNFLKSKTAGLFAGVLWTITHVNFITFQGHYWETARLFGTAPVPWILYFTDRAIAQGRRRDILATIVLASYTFLSSMMSVFDLVFMLSIFAFVRGFLYPYEPRALRDEVKGRTWDLMKLGILGVLGLCLWWYLPAVMPYGVGGFLSVGGNKPPPLQRVLFQAQPVYWFPAIQLPITIIGLLGVIAVLVRQERKGFVLFSWFSLSILSVYVVGIQPERLILNMGLSVVLLSGYLVDSLLKLKPSFLKGMSDERLGQYEKAVVILSMMVLSTLLFVQLPEYRHYSIVDDAYLSSDEYLTATWLSENVNSSSRVYSMYGSRFRGVQWLNVFYPDVQQVLGGFDQGAYATGNERPFEFDNIIKSSPNSTETHQMCREHHVKYVVVDKTWLQGSAPKAYGKLEDLNYFRPVDTLNHRLSYAEAFEVVDIEPLAEEEINYRYWNVWRQSGILLSFLFLVIFVRAID